VPILNELQKAKIIQNRNGLIELSHDSLAAKIVSKRTDEEKAILSAISIIRATKSAQGMLNENQLLLINPYKRKLAAFFKDEEREEMMNFLASCQQVMEMKAKERERQLEKEIKLRRWSNYATAIAIIALIVTFVYWRKQRNFLYSDYLQKADNFFKIGNYSDAKTHYQLADSSQTVLLKKRPIDDRLRDCEQKIAAKKLSDSLINEAEKLDQYDDGDELLLAHNYFSRAASINPNNETLNEKLKNIDLRMREAKEKAAKKFRVFKKMSPEGKSAAAYYNLLEQKLDSALNSRHTHKSE
jgi:hypothetical protein